MYKSIHIPLRRWLPRRRRHIKESIALPVLHHRSATALLPALPAPAAQLQTLVDFIVVSLQPSRIYRIVYAGDAAAACNDLAIVMPANGLPFTELEPVLQLTPLVNRAVYCSLHSESRVIEKLRADHPFYTLHFLPEHILYDRSGADYPETSPEQYLQVKQTAEAVFHCGFRKAQTFYATAQPVAVTDLALALFMLHQAAELTCRSLLLSLEGYDKKTHEIRVLRKSLRRCAAPLLHVFEESDAALWDLLDRCYIDARYETSFTVTREAFDLLAVMVNRLMETATDLLQYRVGETPL